jgi:2-succinyl-5-enolpyruvyl-6-hydroxy-3-cyclohexene-1-carboxylate synthase
LTLRKRGNLALDFRNINTLWASALVGTLEHLGVSLAVVCPGSRSTPLAVAFAQSTKIAAIPVLDERSAAFFALGHGKRTGQPAVVLCTSGTAAANFYPAVIEARESRVPLLVLTADRPPELRDCHSGQTIDQLKLYGNYPNWQAEIALPAVELLTYLQQTITYAWERTLIPNGGAVHLNLPFRDPLSPVAQPEILALAEQISLKFPDVPAITRGASEAITRGASEAITGGASEAIGSKAILNWTIPAAWSEPRGLIVAGIAQPTDPLAYAQAVNDIALALGWPILAEGLSPLRQYFSEQLVTTYDLILREPALAVELQPTVILQLGDLPTSKELRQWLAAVRPQTWILEASVQNVNALHLDATYLRSTVVDLADKLQTVLPVNVTITNSYIERWLKLDRQVREEIDLTMLKLETLCECKIPWLLSQVLPPETVVFVANSMPIRDLEFFWRPNQQRYRILGNRGANGIDGTLSTALGALHQHDQPGILITGDLSLLHDTNGLLLRQQFQGSLTILLINNNGGGIFGMLPIGQFDPPFTEFFTTPQNVDFATLCGAYQIPHQRIESWSMLQTKIAQLGVPGITCWEISTNSELDNQWRKQNLARFVTNI